MDFYNRIALLSLIALPIIILMYMLKNKNKEVVVPSLYLWKMACAENVKSSKLKKINKNIFLLLQLIICTLLAFAMARAYITTNKPTTEYVLVLDSTLSMQAEEAEGTRFEKAKSMALELVQNATPKSYFTIINFCDEPKVVLSESNDKLEVRNAINKINVGYGTGAVKETEDIIKMLCENSEKNVYMFSDSKIDIKGINNVVIGTSSDNVAITRLNSSVDGLSARAFVKVKNYGQKPLERSVNIYADGLLVQTKKVTIKPNQSADVVFLDIDKNSKGLMATLSPNDSLNADDYRYAVIKAESEKKVILCGESSYFLESALSILPNIKIYKSTGNNENLSGYDMYVFEGTLPQSLPKDGHLLIFNPESSSLLTVGEEVGVSDIKTKSSPILNMIEDIDFDILKAKHLELPEWGREIVYSEETPLIILGEVEKQRVVVCGFDIHNTDLALKKDFPILIYNICNWFLPNSVIEGEAFIGQGVELNISPKADSVEVVNSESAIEKIAPPFPVEEYRVGGKGGIYTIAQNTPEGKIYDSFAVNIKDSEESNLLRTDLQSDISAEILSDITVNRDLKNIILAIALAILIIEFLLYIRSISAMPRGAILALRSAIFVLLILSFFDLRIPIKGDKTLTVFAVDNSESMKNNIGACEEFINEAVKTKSDRDSVAVISFGRDTAIESRPTEDKKTYTMQYNVNDGFTDISKAVESVAAMFKSDFNTRLVLLTDGNENIGDGMEAIKGLDSKTDVGVVRYANEILHEVQINSLEVPKYIKKGSVSNIEVSIEALEDTETYLDIKKNGDLIYSNNVELTKGENTFTIKDAVNENGNVIYSADIRPMADTIAENNRISAYSYVADLPSILIIEDNGSGDELEKILEGTNAYVESIEGKAVSADITKLSKYDAIIIANCSIESMTAGLPEVLEGYVKNTGGGLLVTGGENSFALGGYVDTEFEKILPVSMKLKDNEKIPDMAMAIVLDRSGSMVSSYGINKLEIAKEAVARAAQNISSKDSFGLIAFDEGFEWIIPLGKVGENIEKIEKDIFSVTVGGGTAILPALKQASEELGKYDAKLKHIILLTDGLAEEGGFESVIKDMEKNKITLTTVAVGSDSDTTFLQDLAQSREGRYYYADEYTDLPNLFERETYLASKDYLNNIDFYAEVVDEGDILKNVEGIPLLNGYIGTSAKNTANVYLQYDEYNPIVASWQYGLGTTAVFTSDVENWCGDFLSNEDGVKIIRNLISAVERNKLDTSAEVNFLNEELMVKISDDVAVESLKGNVVGTDYSGDISFERVSNSEFKANVDSLSDGVYIINMELLEGDNKSLITTGISIPYSKEYDIRYMNEGERLTDNIIKNGGRKITAPEEVFKNIDSEVKEKKPIATLLILLALLLLLAEIAIRRFNIKFKTKEKNNNKEAVKDEVIIVKKEPNNSPQEVKEEQSKSTSATLLANKRKR